MDYIITTYKNKGENHSSQVWGRCRVPQPGVDWPDRGPGMRWGRRSGVTQNDKCDHERSIHGRERETPPQDGRRGRTEIFIFNMLEYVKSYTFEAYRSGSSTQINRSHVPKSSLERRVLPRPLPRPGQPGLATMVRIQGLTALCGDKDSHSRHQNPIALSV
jgi:hypothetical protein